MVLAQDRPQLVDLRAQFSWQLGEHLGLRPLETVGEPAAVRQHRAGPDQGQPEQPAAETDGLAHEPAATVGCVHELTGDGLDCLATVTGVRAVERRGDRRYVARRRDAERIADAVDHHDDRGVVATDP